MTQLKNGPKQSQQQKAKYIHILHSVMKQCISCSNTQYRWCFIISKTYEGLTLRIIEAYNSAAMF